MSLSVYILIIFVYLFGLNNIDSNYRYLLPLFGMKARFVVSEYIYYLLNLMGFLSLVLIFFAKNYGRYALLSYILLSFVMIFISGIIYVSPLIDFLNVLFSFTMGGIILMEFLLFSYSNNRRSIINDNINYSKYIKIFCGVILVLFNARVILATTDFFNGDNYLDWIVYDAFGIKSKISMLVGLVSIVVVDLVLTTLLFNKLLGVFPYCLFILFYLGFSLNSGFRIYVPEEAVIGYLMELSMGALFVSLILSKRNFWK